MTLGYAENGDSIGGGLTESNSRLTANIALLTQCMAAGFVKTMDGFGKRLFTTRLR